MIRHRVSYWSCGRFADWVRGVKKPLALSHDDWEAWRKDTASNNPVRFWIAEKLLNKVQNFLMFPLDVWRSISAYLCNRFVTKTHMLKTGLAPGVYHELDERILHGLFNELKEFVEVETAHKHSCFSEKKYKFKRGRCPEAGVDHLVWASGLKFGGEGIVSKKDPKYGKPTPQAESASKILELYNWWLLRPNRPDPWEESGEGKRDSSAFKKKYRIENRYAKEDEKMLLSLIKVRGSLWT